MKITVIDRICGGSKTQDMIARIKDSVNSNSGDKFLYITPYLEQCHSIAGTTPVGEKDDRPQYDANGVIYENNEFNLGFAKFKHPDNRNKDGVKQESLRRLMQKGENIVSTHNLFLNMKLDTLSNAEDYTLCIDEALDVYDRCRMITQKHAKKLLRLRILYTKEDGITLGFDRKLFGDIMLLDEDEDAVEDTGYEELAVLCDNNQILVVNDHVMVWEFSSEILKKFKKVYILTYLFEGREMSVYLKKHNIEYEVLRSGRGGKDTCELVEILYDDKLNSIGDGDYALSVSRTKVEKRERHPPERGRYESEEKFKKAVTRYDNYLKSLSKPTVSAYEINETLRKNLHTVFSTRWKAKAKDRYFTCLSENQEKIAGKNYKNDWLSYSIKATNLYKNTHHVAFLMNVFMQPTIKQVCDSTDYKVDEDLVALSHLIQFVFRSALRCGEPIKLYIPSQRMRELFENYLNGDYDE